MQQRAWLVLLAQRESQTSSDHLCHQQYVDKGSLRHALPVNWSNVSCFTCLMVEKDFQSSSFPALAQGMWRWHIVVYLHLIHRSLEASLWLVVTTFITGDVVVIITSIGQSPSNVWAGVCNTTWLRPPYKCDGSSLLVLWAQWHLHLKSETHAWASWEQIVARLQQISFRTCWESFLPTFLRYGRYITLYLSYHVMFALSIQHGTPVNFTQKLKEYSI